MVGMILLMFRMAIIGRMLMYEIDKWDGFWFAVMIEMLNNDRQIQYKYHYPARHSQAKRKYYHQYILSQNHSTKLVKIPVILKS